MGILKSKRKEVHLKRISPPSCGGCSNFDNKENVHENEEID